MSLTQVFAQVGFAVFFQHHHKRPCRLASNTKTGTSNYLLPWPLLLLTKNFPLLLVGRLQGGPSQNGRRKPSFKRLHQPGVNFINILRERFLYKSLCTAFFYLSFSFVIFCRQNLYKKRSRKTLMKSMADP